MTAPDLLNTALHNLRLIRDKANAALRAFEDTTKPRVTMHDVDRIGAVSDALDAIIDELEEMDVSNL